MLRHRPERASQPWLRAFAALLALAAGAVHLGQVGVHVEEGWPIAAFFLVVGVVQVAAAALLLRPRPRLWFWFGIAGSATVIAIWVVSRTAGLPFVEGGQAEPIGVADGFASLAEAWTILLLGLYLAEPVARWRRAIFGLGAALAVGFAVVWVMAGNAGVFDADPARFAAPLPPLIDWLVAASGFALGGGLMIGAGAPLLVAWLRGLMWGLVGASALVAFALVWLTLPPTIGQNLQCDYAPLSTVLTGSHAADREPVVIGLGQRWILPVFELRACGDVALDRVQQGTEFGEGATIEGFWLLPVKSSLSQEGQEVLPALAQAVPPGDQIEPGRPQQLVVQLVGTGAGEYMLASVRLSYHTENPGSFTFATQISVCSGRCGGA